MKLVYKNRFEKVSLFSPFFVYNCVHLIFDVVLIFPPAEVAHKTLEIIKVFLDNLPL